ncbi:16698_t:CDS:2 [Funneliformis caledonium]|uniref:16698_t:CDS:1 n=1 Tax=Funneliformis caledonium TaxID=1117310 RepID=A0A9N9FJU2_9GLOM|nr:16698_t:CDS:2 [Funneliformis caledonium]
MYHSNSVRNIDNEENNNDKNNENKNQQDNKSSEVDSDLDIIEDNEQVIRGGNWDTILTTWNKMLDAEENAERQMEYEDMLENNIILRDNNAKWELGKLFSVDLDPPKYCEKL